MPPLAGGSSGGLPSRVEYLSPPGVLLPRVYGTIASPLWLELRGPAAWQATPSWVVCQHTWHRLLLWPRVTFAMVPDAAQPGSDQWPWSTAPATGPAGRLVRPSASDRGGVVGCALSLCRPRCARVRYPWPLGSCSPVCTLSVLCCACNVLGHLAPLHRCARSMCLFRGPFLRLCFCVFSFVFSCLMTSSICLCFFFCVSRFFFEWVLITLQVH